MANWLTNLHGLAGSGIVQRLYQIDNLHVFANEV